MEPNFPIQYLLIYKLCTLFSGVFFSYLGYRLFIAGFVNNTGEFSAEAGANKVGLKNVAPGIYFSLFGTIIICFAVFSGFNFVEKGETITRVLPKHSKKAQQDSLPKLLSNDHKTTTNTTLVSRKPTINKTVEETNEPLEAILFADTVEIRGTYYGMGAGSGSPRNMQNSENDTVN